MEVKTIEISQVQSLDNIRIREIEKDVHTLMASIEAYGLLQPIGVFGTQQKGYVIVWGNRRFIASKKLGLKTIPAVIVDSEEMSEEDFLIHNAIENIQRKEITTYELGKTCEVLVKKGYSKDEIAVKLNVPTSRVKNALNDFRKIPEKYRDRIISLKNNVKKGGKIGSTVSNGILGVVKTFNLDKKQAEQLFDKARADSINSRKLKLIAIFLKKGLNINQALKKVDEYDLKEIVVAIPLKQVEKEKEKLQVKYFCDLAQKMFDEKFKNSYILSKTTH